MNSLISVIVPAYNHEIYVQQCINSIISQDYLNIELIILNDGSKDDTWNKILEMESICNDRFKRTVLINKDNEGVSKTLNLGIKKSKGDFLVFIASDDMMFPNRISIQYDFMMKNKCKISCSNSKFIYNDKITENFVLDENLKNMYTGDQFSNLIINYFISSPSVMINRSIIDEFGYFDEECKIEDWPYYVRVASKYKIEFIDEALCYYRIHGNNTQTQKSKMYKIEKEIIKSFFLEYNVSNKIKRKAVSMLIIRNKKRRKYKIMRFMDIVLSQIIYLDFSRIKNKIMKIWRDTYV